MACQWEETAKGPHKKSYQELADALQHRCDVTQLGKNVLSNTSITPLALSAILTAGGSPTHCCFL